ncbi:MAG TPA: hypothetical protein VK171_14845, partial [Fimbriimonas sp.]|nr:hypothetical protein [Fimbriimonas sp.]
GGPLTLGQTFLSPAQLLECPLPLSFTPGNYLCNFLLYSLLWRMPTSRVGFVHVPLFETVPKETQLEQIRQLLTSAS